MKKFQIFFISLQCVILISFIYAPYAPAFSKCIQGPCIYGQGIRTSIYGDKYVGEFKAGVKNGQGTFTWANGDKYVGEWKDDKRNGRGTFTWANGDKYVGEWEDDKKMR